MYRVSQHWTVRFLSAPCEYINITQLPGQQMLLILESKSVVPEMLCLHWACHSVWKGVAPGASGTEVELVAPCSSKEFKLRIDVLPHLQVYLPLMEDLCNPAMRTWHWKQLVRVTGGAVNINTNTLARMTLGELLSLGLHSEYTVCTNCFCDSPHWMHRWLLHLFAGHGEGVAAIVQRAVKDSAIERCLKMYEEVWLGKIFQFRKHVRSLATGSGSAATAGTQAEEKGDVVGWALSLAVGLVLDLGCKCRAGVAAPRWWIVTSGGGGHTKAVWRSGTSQATK